MRRWVLILALLMVTGAMTSTASAEDATGAGETSQVEPGEAAPAAQPAPTLADGGALPPSLRTASDAPGMPTPRGEVAQAGEGAMAGAPAELPPGAVPLGDSFFFDFHGYYRARLLGIYNAPVRNPSPDPDVTPPEDEAANANFGFMRLRLNPRLRYGSDPNKPIVSLMSQIDILDNVVFGDNARLGPVPSFAEDPSTTDIFGEDREFIFIRRLWLEVLSPVGLVRIGRQPSHGGLGLLFNDGNGFRNDFGDAREGSTFDRFTFATRPLTIVNALVSGDRSETPWILGIAYDWLVEDPLGFGSGPVDTPTAYRRGAGPFGWLSNRPCAVDDPATDEDETDNLCDDDVQQFIVANIWRQDDLVIFKDSDALELGYVFVWRTQDFNNTDLFIHDVWWKFQMAMGYGAPSLYTAGEVTHIHGQSNGISLRGSYNAETGLTDEELVGDVLNVVGRLGVVDEAWDAIFEMGYASGDEELLGEEQFKTFPINPDYRVGLLMYPVVLNARSTMTAAGQLSNALNSQGGIWNSTYLYPHFRYRPLPSGNIEIVGAFLTAFADTLNGSALADYYTVFDPTAEEGSNKCGFFSGDCWIGWEADLAIKLNWVPRDLGGGSKTENYMMRWSNEFGIMGAGTALEDRLKEDIIWTLQSRIAMVW